MRSSCSPHTSEKISVLLVGGGLLWIAAAQMIEDVPVAAAIAVIALGILQHLQAKESGSMLVAVNFVVYAALVALAVASQTHATLSTPGANVGLPLLVDHALAITLLVAVLIGISGSEESADDVR